MLKYKQGYYLKRGAMTMANDFFKIDDSRKRKHLIDVLQVKKRRADISEEELLEAAGISSSKLERLGINLRKAKTEDEQVKVIDNEMTHGAVMGALKLIDQKGMKHVPAPAKIIRTRESIEAQRKALEAKRIKHEQEAKELAAKSVANVTTQPQIAMPSAEQVARKTEAEVARDIAQEKANRERELEAASQDKIVNKPFKLSDKLLSLKESIANMDPKFDPNHYNFVVRTADKQEAKERDEWTQNHQK